MVNAREILDAGGNATNTLQVSLSSAGRRSWCIAKDFAKPDPVQQGLDWACGYGAADCAPIEPGNSCFLPNTVYSHASYAFNSYYQMHQQASLSCDFNGVATVTYEDPSYPGCIYPFRIGQLGAISKATVTFIHRYWAPVEAFIVIFMLLCFIP
ncbi:hypothetical protein KP509_13G041800 [Ceratopteris richardii]|nr:hypothetical protein KP509_13G041800 [Ceratopteris richardii]